jgi:tripartite-type tricarboxylate transporter receptor subunit TctC
MRQLLLAFLFAAIVQSIGAASAVAQTYPSRPVTIIVPFPAGGPTDVVARVLADRIRAPLGQTVVVENISGAVGALGTGRVARAAPDGHMLVIGHAQTHVLNAATQNLQFDVVKDFEPVALIADTPQWLIAKKALPPNNVTELIAWLKGNPGKATSGTVGAGSSPEIAAVYFQRETGTNFVLVPYRGGAPLIQDLLAGQIDMTFGQAANYLGPVRNGLLKPYAVLAKKRWWAMPEVPTMDEAGVPGFYASFWHGLWAPKGTPKDIIAKVNAAIVEALADPDIRKRFADIGQEIWPRDQQSPEALAAQQKAEIEKWWPVIKAAGIKVQ